MGSPPRRTVVAELLAMTALLLSYIWLWQDAFPGDFLACVGLYLAIGGFSHVRRRETLRQIGIRFDNAPRAALQALLFVGPLLVIPPVVGSVLGTVHFPAAGRWPSEIVEELLWGTAQQYGLLCFFLRRLGELLPGKTSSILAAAALFATFHLPNPFLTAVTLATGALACWLYLRVPNVLVLGAAHALLSIVISGSLPVALTFSLRVGPGFWKAWEQAWSG